MSLFGSMMGDVEDDPFFGSHMRHMRHMNNMMSSMFGDPFGMLGGGPLAIAGPGHPAAMMPFMPQMPSLNRLLSGHHMPDMDGHMNTGASFSSSTFVMSNGPHGKPQVYSSSSSTKIGPNGIKETRNTLQDSRTGTKKMSIGHHIGERAHVIEREQNVYSGDAEERQEYINIEEEEADDFNREFQTKAGATAAASRMRALPPAPAPHRRSPPPRLALPPAPSNASSDTSPRRQSTYRPAARRPLRTTSSPLTSSPSVREVYGGPHPQPRHRHKHHKAHAPHPAHTARPSPADDHQ